MPSGIYSIIHIASGKPYVGSAINIEKRWSEHKAELQHNYHDNPRLQNSWNKYGAEAFEFKILEEVNDPTSLLIREQYWMDELQSYDRNKGFNIRQKAESNLGLKHKPEIIEKIRQSNLGKHNGYVGKNNPFFGKKHSKETRKKMHRPKSPEGKEAIAKSARERPSTIEAHLKKICNWCNKEFDTLRSVNTDFCCGSCRSMFYGDKKRKESLIIRNCLVCQKEIKTNISQGQKYCSRSCYFQSQRSA